jgi:tetratricopeptide (TPR) repeat protein
LALLAGLILLPLWCLSANPGSKKKLLPASKPPVALLPRADSLFTKGQYAAASSLYHQQVWQKKQVSPQLLLKLAYAQQQLGHFPAALLYLNMAYAREPQLRTWRQLATLAAQHRLIGYPSTWQQELRVRAQQYYYSGLQLLLVGAVVGAVWLLLRRARARRTAWLLYGCYLGLAGAYLFLLRPTPAGVVARSGAAVMAGPGAGAPWLSTAALGDRLLVLDKQDIWYRVRWQRRIAFIREADLLVVDGEVRSFTKPAFLSQMPY